MLTDRTGNWTVRGITFALWAAAAASAAYWGLKLGGGGAGGLPVAPPARPALQADPSAVARLLGQTAGAPGPVDSPAAPTSARLQLLGVVADGAQHGAALISVDGRPAKPFRVGATVDEGLVLQSVRGRQAVLAASRQGPAVATLEMPPPLAASTAPAAGNAAPGMPGGMAPFTGSGSAPMQPPPGGQPAR